MRLCLRMKKKRDVKSEEIFMKNGRMLLEELVASCNGKCNPIHNFSAKELQKGTGNYNENHVLQVASDYKMYKGILQDHPVLVKKFNTNVAKLQFVINDIVIASQMSVHKNVLKLFGCCLETQIPTLVFEYAENGTVIDNLCHPSKTHSLDLHWKTRLRIARDTAHALAYLHNAFSRPIIYRDIKPSNIYLTESNIAKLCDFSHAVSIPEGESQVEDSVGWSMGLVAPEFLATGFLTEKTDIFSFGFFLLVLLTGQTTFGLDRPSNYGHITLQDCVKHHLENNKLNEIVDPTIMGEGEGEGEGGGLEQEQQMHAFIALAFRCLRRTAEDRPTMIEVGKQLRKIEQSVASH
ncbi:hypothetical protein F0562_029343 [Nyssa sinensis]|uniref:Protein kinase domain-containing protein n=1 Tax=Nyssa sinensis TaxID=561372 RepID=A0A5J5B0S6_9ASTE|nr:hypothetical protein F0562_029343 [Nyssa sinensis]